MAKHSQLKAVISFFHTVTMATLLADLPAPPGVVSF